MEVVYLEATIREDSEIGRRNVMEREGFVPCVVYGLGKKTLSLKIERSRLVKFMHAHHGAENMIITLKVGSGGSKKSEEKSVLIKEIQVHPVSGSLLHLDFNEISLTEAIEVKVPIHKKGEPAGTKQEGGTLEHILWEIEVECLPTEIPEKIEVDVSNMQIGDTIYVKDLILPAKVTLKHDPEAIVFHLEPPHKEEIPAEAPVEGVEGAEPEVIKKEKKLEEGEEEAAQEPAKEEKKEQKKEK